MSLDLTDIPVCQAEALAPALTDVRHTQTLAKSRENLTDAGARDLGIIFPITVHTKGQTEARHWQRNALKHAYTGSR